MKTIHKFILKSYFGPMIMTFFIVMFVLLMNFLWRYIDDLVGKGLEMGIILELMGYAMANMISLGLPLSMLLAAIMTMGNLGESYELLAMKSAGMSLPRIITPLIIVVGLIAIGSFFIANNLVPYSNKKMQSLMFDISQQKQTIEFQDGLFFNGIDNLSIRVAHQDPNTHLLNDVLIYDNRKTNGDMNTIIADSGYIRLSDNKRFLMITLFHGQSYDQTRNFQQWYGESTLGHLIFDKQEMAVPLAGFDMQRTDANDFSKNSQTKNINELQTTIDSLKKIVSSATSRSYEPLLKDQVFAKDFTVLDIPDSLKKDKRLFGKFLAIDSIAPMPLRDKAGLYNQARSMSKNSRSMFSIDETTAKDALNQLYRSQIEWHSKLSLPVSILLFFLIGAPLGAIIRKGGLGMPIVISVIFFVIYYIITIAGQKMSKEGTWEAIYGMWLSTFILTPIAIYLTYKATNDTSLLDTDWYIIKYKALQRWISDHLKNIKSRNNDKQITQ